MRLRASRFRCSSGLKFEPTHTTRTTGRVTHKIDVTTKAFDVQPPHLRYQLNAKTIAISQHTKRVTANQSMGSRMGFAWAGSLDRDVIAATLADARDNARFATPDPDMVLAVPDGVAAAELELWDDSVASTPMGVFSVIEKQKMHHSNIYSGAPMPFMQRITWSGVALHEGGNLGHRPAVKGGYFPVPPVDSQQDIRTAMSMACEEMGLKFEVHHHEVATAGQGEINVAANTLTKKADEVQILKYALQNVAHGYGKTLTFMPKPIVGDNGSGMHVHQSLQKDGKALFAGDKYGGLSDIALYYIGGIIKHARAINAFTNASTNSYKRLVPGFEAPVKLAYSARNRSASIRIPWIANPKGRRIEVRFPDATGNPYFMFAAMLLAGLDGIQNKIHPGDPADKDLYDLEPEEDKKIPTVCHSLDMALDYLDKDRGFLKAGGVFTDDLIDAYIELKMKEVTRLRMTTHPIEIEMYYSL